MGFLKNIFQKIKTRISIIFINFLKIKLIHNKFDSMGFLIFWISKNQNLHSENLFLFFKKSLSLLKMASKTEKPYYSILSTLSFFPDFFIIFPGSGIWFPVDWATQNFRTIFFRIYRIIAQKGCPYWCTPVILPENFLETRFLMIFWWFSKSFWHWYSGWKLF